MKDFDQVIILLKEYKKRYGDCLVPRSYITENGIHLGKIVSNIRAGVRKTNSDEKAILDSLGFVWRVNKSPLVFKEVIRLLKDYKEKYGDCLVPYSYITEDGVRLGRIVNNIRTGVRKTSSTEKEMLDSLSFVWKIREIDQVIILLKEYKKQYGNCLVPRSYITENGIYLGGIVHSIRTGRRKTSADEKAILDSLGFVWRVNKTPLSFEEVVRLLKEYKEKYGDCLVPYSYITEDGVRLGRIVNNIRTGVRKISSTEKEMLDSLGFVWNVDKSLVSFEEVVRLLKEYKKQYGDYLVPRSYITENGIHLGWIVNTIRSGARKTSAEQKAMLDSLGFVWRVKRKSPFFEELFILLQEYKKQYGDCLVPQSYITENGIYLGGIVHSIRTGRRKTSADEKAMLDNLGFVWRVKKEKN